MILTVCLSPCTDVTIELDSLNVGKVNIVKSKSLAFTGKALNVAIGVSRLGGDVFTTGFMYNENGSMFINALDREGVKSEFVWNKGRVRENYKFIDNRSMLTQVNDVGESVSDDNLQKLLDNVASFSAQSNVTVISGGLPRGVSADYYEQLFARVNKNSLKVVDAEGVKLFSALRSGVDLAKPSIEELENTLGRRFESKEDMLDGCAELIDRGAKCVLLSLGREGAVDNRRTKKIFLPRINVAVNSTVGAGDGMVAAAASVMERGGDLKDILKAGVAAGTATVTTFGEVSFTKDKYEDIYAHLEVKEI